MPFDLQLPRLTLIDLLDVGIFAVAIYVLLVMGSVAHTGIPGLLIGNTAEEVMRQIQSSVLTLKPTDFSFLLPCQLR